MNNRTLPSRIFYTLRPKRASAFASAHRKASITVEASMAVPIFFFAVVSLLYLMEIMSIQTAVRSGQQYAGKKLAEKAYVLPAAVPSRIERDIVDAVGADRLERSIIQGGSSGIQCGKSRMSGRTGICELAAEYKIKVPVPIFSIPPVKYQEKMRIKGWTGYEKNGFGTEREETVYVTETGLVYHKDYHCTHLELSIHMVPAGEVGGLRNESGGKYYPCEHCAGSSQPGRIYITDTGDRYHNSIGCSGLKRTVYAVPLSEVRGKGACSRCGR